MSITFFNLIITLVISYYGLESIRSTYALLEDNRLLIEKDNETFDQLYNLDSIISGMQISNEINLINNQYTTKQVLAYAHKELVVPISKIVTTFTVYMSLSMLSHLVYVLPLFV